MEPQIISILSKQFPANIPNLIASNESLHCFLMEDAGIRLRKFLKAEFSVELLSQAIQQYSAILRSTENDIETFPLSHS